MMARLILPAAVMALGARGDAHAGADGALPGDTRAQALAEIAHARAAQLDDVGRTISLPSIERLVEDADERAAHPTVRERDEAFVARTLATARDFARRLAAGDDPYRTATGTLVKAYRAEWDGTLQPYALYLPRGYSANKRWPLIVALHGAFSDHRHNLRRVFGLDNRPGETDFEASRNELPLPDVPAIVVSPYGRGEVMGYDGLGGDDVMRVLADVRRAYNVDPERITLTGLSMGGGGTWQIGLRHPELFAALAPVCGVANFKRMIRPEDAAFYDLAALEAQSPRALAENARHMRVFVFHGARDSVVPVSDSREMVERFRALGFLGRNVRYTEYPGVDHAAWVPAYKAAALLRTLAAIKRDPAAPKSPAPPPPAGVAIPGLFGKSVPRQHPHIYVYGTHGTPAAVDAARALANALADWGPMVGAHFVVKRDRDVTSDDRARFNLVLVGDDGFNALTPAVPPPGGKPPGPGALAFRALVGDAKSPSGFSLVLGGHTPEAFARLRALFARPNKDTLVPEPNARFAYVAE